MDARGQVTVETCQWRDDLVRALRSLSMIFGKDLPWSGSRAIWTHSHEFYQLDYFYGGYGKVRIAGEEYSVTPGDLFITNPGEDHEFTAAVRQPMEGFVLKFEMGDARNRPTFPNYVANLGRLSRNQQLELEHFLRRACVEMNKPGTENADLAAAFVSVFFRLLLRYLDDIENLFLESDVSRSERLLNYMKEHYDRQITLRDLARIAQVDPEYLCHRFSVEIGLSPMAALTRERMEAAKNLLVNTRLSISEVGVRVGYPDAYHFSKRFKAIVGLSPKQFREQLVQVPVDLPPQERASGIHPGQHSAA